MRIKEYSAENRPRERLLSEGVKSLSDAEVLALVLRSGTTKENVLEMSNKLLSSFGLSELSTMSVQELMTLDGVGIAKASEVVASFELGRRARQNGIRSKPLRCAKDVYTFCHSRFIGVAQEQFLVLHLDTKNCVVKEEVVSVGTLNSSLVHPREVFKSAVRESAHAVIFVHNHPSGDVTPSDEDAKVTKQLVKVGDFMGIKVLDHVIIGDGAWFSFTEKRTGHSP